jgi:hypothetical protein
MYTETWSNSPRHYEHLNWNCQSDFLSPTISKTVGTTNCNNHNDGEGGGLMIVYRLRSSYGIPNTAIRQYVLEIAQWLRSDPAEGPRVVPVDPGSDTLFPDCLEFRKMDNVESPVNLSVITARKLWSSEEL